MAPVFYLSSVTQSCLIPCDPMDCSMPDFPDHHQLQNFLNLTSIELVMPSNYLILCCPLLLLTSIFPSIRVFFSESVLRVRCPKYWSFSFSISPSNEYSGLISFRIDWFNLLEFQGTLKSLLQHHSSKASTLRHAAFFMVQLSYPYMNTEKTIALTIWTFVGKVISLLFNMVFRSVIAFLPRSKCLLISWLQSPSVVILEPKKKPVNCLKGGKKAMFCISVFVGLKIALLCECMSSKIRIMPYSTVLYPVAFFN